jgi:recombination protein RecA
MADKKPLTREQFFAAQNKKYGAGAIRLLSNTNHAEIKHWSSTGIYGLDDAMAWGYPGGRMIETFGPESSGKTTALMAGFIENARNGGQNYLADPEGTFDRDRYVQMGGQPDDVALFYPTHLENFYDWAMDMTSWAKTQEMPENALMLIGLDTMATMIPKEVLEAEAEDRTVGAMARVNAANLPKLDMNLGHNTCLVILNQVRDKIGTMAWSQEGNIDTPGGRIIKHAASIRILFNKSGQIDNGKSKDDREIIGMKTQAKVVKSKIGPPLRKTDFRIMFDHRGVDNVDHCLNAFIRKGIVGKPVKGVFTIKDSTFTRNTFYEFVKTHPKWIKWALGETFELYHETINIDRYLAGPKIEETNEAAE